MKRQLNESDLKKRINLTSNKRNLLLDEWRRLYQRMDEVNKESERLHKLLQRQCKHRWDKREFKPEVTKVFMGYIPVEGKKRWRRTCRKCGQRQFTYDQGKSASWKNEKEN